MFFLLKLNLNTSSLVPMGEEERAEGQQTIPIKGDLDDSNLRERVFHTHFTLGPLKSGKFGLRSFGFGKGGRRDRLGENLLSLCFVALLRQCQAQSV